MAVPNRPLLPGQRRIRALSLHQPWASAMGLLGPDGQPLKSVETRSWAPPRDAIGQPFAIASTLNVDALRVMAMTHQEIGGWSVERNDSEGEWEITEDGSTFWRLPLGCIVASGVLQEIRRTEDCHWRYGPPGLIVGARNPERKWGDFSPGRWAWRFDDVKPTTERCPWCWGDGGFKVDSMTLYGIPGGEDWGEMCPVCDGKGKAGSVPVTGRQRIWWWDGTVREVAGALLPEEHHG